MPHFKYIPGYENMYSISQDGEIISWLERQKNNL